MLIQYVLSQGESHLPTHFLGSMEGNPTRARQHLGKEPLGLTGLRVGLTTIQMHRLHAQLAGPVRVLKPWWVEISAPVRYVGSLRARGRGLLGRICEAAIMH